MNTKIWAVLAAVALAGFGGLLYVAFDDGAGSMLTQENQDNSSVLALVNGAEVTEAMLDTRTQEITQTLGQTGLSEDENNQLRGEVLQSLINETLILQEARESGISVDETDVDARIEEVSSQLGEEEFQAALSQRGLTEQALRDSIERTLLFQQYVDATIGEEQLSVTDAEIQEAYDTVAAQAPEGQEIPPLEQVSDSLREQLRQQKLQEALNVIIARLRNEAEIEVLVETAQATTSTDATQETQ